MIGLALAGIALAGNAAAPAESAARPPHAVVRLGEYFFRPARISVRVGQPVTFVNVGRIQHTVADTDARGRIRSRLIKPRPLSHGQRQTVIFHRPGTVRYLCTFHPTLMTGAIQVRR